MIDGGESFGDNDILDLRYLLGNYTVHYSINPEVGSVDRLDTFGRVLSSFTFSNIETIIGGSGADTLTLATAAIAGRFDLGAGADTLVFGDFTNSATLSNIETIIGGSGADTIVNLGSTATTIFGGAGNDRITGGDGADTAIFKGAFSSYSVSYNSKTTTFTISGGADGADTITGVELFQFGDATKTAGELIAPRILSGTPASDTFVITSGSNSVSGGAGSDTVRYQTVRAASEVTFKEGVVTVRKADGTDTLTSVERIDFSDGDLILDMTSSNAPNAYRLYGGAFDRTPDEGGFRFWTQTLDKGHSLHSVAASFIDSPEFVSRYGNGLSNAAFVDALYQNILDRRGETGGVTYWNRMLDNKYQDRAEVLVEFTRAPEYLGIIQADIKDGYWVV